MDHKDLIERLREYSQSWAAYNNHGLSVALQDAATAIETLLAEREKAVEIVRCADCKYSKYDNGYLLCDIHYEHVGADYFCASAIRRETVK